MPEVASLHSRIGCLYNKQTQRAFNVFKNTLNWLKVDTVDQKFNWLECGNFSQDAGTPRTERDIAFSQLAVKGLSYKSSVEFSKKCSSTNCIYKLSVLKSFPLLSAHKTVLQFLTTNHRYPRVSKCCSCTIFLASNQWYSRVFPY
jgi:hypothetical protein